MAGREQHLPHTLVPLALAVSVVRSRVAAVAGADPDAVATLIASAVPVFEYWDTPVRLPKPLANTLREGVFRDAGGELHFVDGRPTKYRLAVRARAAALRGTTEKLLARASLLSQPAYPGAAPSP